jgi:1-acyl-sn-glycerol-3-phosphate acyltransferase
MSEHTKQPQAIPHPALYTFAIHTAVTGFLHHWGNLRVANPDVIAQQAAPYILAPNHRSMIDILALGMAVHTAVPGTQINFMGKQELWDVPVVPKLFTALGGFPIDRSQSLQPDTLMQSWQLEGY